MGLRPGNDVIINNGDASVDLVSPAYLLEYVVVLAVQASITGSPTGTLRLQGSCDAGNPKNPLPNINTWTDILNSPTSVTGAGSVSWNYKDPGYKWIRALYTAASGTGNITVTINTKGF